MGILYLLPNLLGESKIEDVIPVRTTDIIKKLRVFATENVRNTRRYLKKIDRGIDIDSLLFLNLNKDSGKAEIDECLKYLSKEDVGIISESGCPGIADPGAELIALAHAAGYRVIPLVGPSSILLALMASGCSGQYFSFNGYLPIPKAERIKALRNYEKESAIEDRSQIFIETPYRNISLFQDLIATLSPSTKLCIACDITVETEYIKTKTIKEWRNKMPNINKRPAIFIIYAGNPSFTSIK